MNSNKKLYKAVDLFAGVGGIRLGFEYAFNCHSDSSSGIETVFVCEQDSKARHTYENNFGTPVDKHAWGFDIRDQGVKESIPKFNICLAGFPCQAFSNAGHRQGFEDEKKRGTLFFDVAEICKKHQPEVIFCENVKGLIIHDKGRTLKVILSSFNEIGYDVYYKVLNSKDYGVPQNRERIYIVAFRNDLKITSFKFPDPTDSTKTIKDILEDAPISSKYYLSDIYLKTLIEHKKRHQEKGHGFGYEIRSLNSIAGAIVCGGMGRERNLIIDEREHSLVPVTNIKGEINKEGIRKMTPREWARLQGFGDDFKIVVSDTQSYKQFGNSVTVNVIEEIAKKIKEVLIENDDRK